MRYANCQDALDALANGLDESTCHDFRGIREVVGCAVWHDMQLGPPLDFQDLSARFHDAWSRVRTACIAHGGTKPEFGLLQPDQEAVPQTTWAVRDKSGKLTGFISVESDGSLMSCIRGECNELPPGSVDDPQLVGDVLQDTLPVVGYELVRS